jgi:hypothetical protein
MIDVQAAIRTFIKQKPAVVALVGDRVYAGRNVPPPGYEPATGSAVAFMSRGGSMAYGDGLARLSVQVKCYGETEVDANTLYTTFVNAVHNGRSSVVRFATVESLGITLEEPDTEWPFVLSYFNFHIRMEVDEHVKP